LSLRHHVCYRPSAPKNLLERRCTRFAVFYCVGQLSHVAWCACFMLRGMYACAAGCNLDGCVGGTSRCWMLEPLSVRPSCRPRHQRAGKRTNGNISSEGTVKGGLGSDGRTHGHRSGLPLAAEAEAVHTGTRIRAHSRAHTGMHHTFALARTPSRTRTYPHAYPHARMHADPCVCTQPCNMVGWHGVER
jgi:hypothetical protein